MKKQWLLILLFLFAANLRSWSQTIEIAAKDVPLNKIFVELRDNYHLRFSFNDQLLSEYKISITKKFSSPDEAISSLIKGLPLTCIKQGEIFIILAERKEASPKIFHLTGQVTEDKTGESLPFAKLLVGNRIINSDENGNFSFTDLNDSIFPLKISYLGHYVLDTIVPAGNNYRFKLLSTFIGLKEIVIKGLAVDKTTLIGDKAGAMKINNQVARYLPGNDDNSVFNLLRLMPGILASSEQSNGVVIWGSYEGFSQIMFDGFTIWGLKSFNEDINTVNPLITKDMEVLKGGYDASYGERVGGIVRISGKDGNDIKPSFTLNLNNVTMNGVVQTPLWHNTSLLLSFRQTYYNLYRGKDILSGQEENVLNQGTGSSVNQYIDYTVFPDYSFHDGSIKFTTRNNKGKIFYISLLGGEDKFKYTIDQNQVQNELFLTKEESNTQTGASVFYGNTWKSGYRTNFTVTWSGLKTDVTDIQELPQKSGLETINKDNLTSNSIKEYSASIDNWITLNKSNQIEAGGGFILNEVGLEVDSSGINQTSMNEESKRFNAFIQDHIALAGNINITCGLRGDYPTNLAKLYLQPRFSASIGISEVVRVNAAWGKYNQFIAKSSVLDNLGNYRYIWTNANNKDVPVLDAEHWVVGSSYKKNDFTLSIEGYYKSTKGLTRFININQNIQNTIFQGDGRSYGLDLFIKKDFKGHSAWISYTLSKTEERFPYFIKDEYMRAPQDQRHEIKTAILLNVKPFYFSANYIFGSGFPINTGTILNPKIFEPDYNRLDIALILKFQWKKLMGETGISILNVFDSKNIRYSNFERVPLDQINTINIYSEAVPFSPRLTLKLDI